MQRGLQGYFSVNTESGEAVRAFPPDFYPVDNQFLRVYGRVHAWPGKRRFFNAKRAPP